MVIFRDKERTSTTLRFVRGMRKRERTTVNLHISKLMVNELDLYTLRED